MIYFFQSISGLKIIHFLNIFNYEGYCKGLKIFSRFLIYLKELQTLLKKLLILIIFLKFRLDMILMTSLSNFFFQFPNYKLKNLMYGHKMAISSVKFSTDGRFLGSASADKTINIWNTDSGYLERTISGHELGLNDLCWSADSRLIASSSDDTTLKVWDSSSVRFNLISTRSKSKNFVDKSLNFCKSCGQKNIFL